MTFEYPQRDLHDTRELAQLLTKLEQGDPEVYKVIESIDTVKCRAHRIGITGSAGSGKSSLINHLITSMRSQNRSIGILTIDPTSVFSGGAVLADRIRMQQHAEDRNVFIRSLASRDFKGHLTSVIWGAVTLLEAAGKDTIIIETSGSGQTDVDIYYVVDTVVLLLVPEGGDAIQILKSGIMEIADIYAINKSDRPGADILAKTVQAHLHLSESSKFWSPPIIKTQANKGSGITELCEALDQHHQSLLTNPSSRSKLSDRRHREFVTHTEIIFSQMLNTHLKTNKKAKKLLKEVQSGAISPYVAAERLVDKISEFMHNA